MCFFDYRSYDFLKLWTWFLTKYTYTYLIVKHDHCEHAYNELTLIMKGWSFSEGFKYTPKLADIIKYVYKEANTPGHGISW